MTTNDVEKIYNKLVEWGSLKESQLLLDDLIDEFSTREQKDDPGKTNRQNFRETDPSTSKKASFAHEPRAKSNRALALRAICQRAPLGSTFMEAAELSGIKEWEITKRISELKQGGWILAVGEQNGRSVYYPTEKAMDWYG